MLRSIWSHSLPRRDDHVPAHAAAQLSKHSFRNKTAEKIELSASELFDLYLDYPKYRKQFAGLAAAVNFHQWTPPTLVDLDIAAHDPFRRIAAQEFATQQTVTQDDVAPIGHGSPVIQHHARQAAWAQDPVDLAHRALGVWRVMQDAVGINDLETPIGERQAFAVRDRKVATRAVD